MSAITIFRQPRRQGCKILHLDDARSRVCNCFRSSVCFVRPRGNPMRITFIEAVFAICLTLVFAQFAAASTYVTFDVPGGRSAGVPYGINKWGSVTGSYTTCSSPQPQGFLYRSNGVITTFAVPGAWGTNPMSIN